MVLVARGAHLAAPQAVGPTLVTPNKKIDAALAADDGEAESEDRNQVE